MALAAGMRSRDASLEQPSRRRMSAIVLNHRTVTETFRAVESLLASSRRPDHLIVVDNDVADECRSRFENLQVSTGESRVPDPEPRRPSCELTYIHTGCNLGFSGGMNAGLAAALANGAELVVLVNSDTEVSSDCLGRLEAIIDKSAPVGIAGPVVLLGQHRDRVSSAGIRYNSRSGRMREQDCGKLFSSSWSGTEAVDAVSGCLMMVKRDVFDAVGLLDDRYFFGFEDLDFCLRARAAGFATICVRDAVVFHEGGRSMGTQSSRRYYFGARNHLLLASRRAAGEGSGALALRLSWVTVLNVAHALTSRAGFLPARLTATFRGVRDYCSGRYGPDPVA